MSSFEEISIVAACILFVVNVVIYIKTIRSLSERIAKCLLVYTIVLCSIYPLVSAVALLSVVIPKLWLVSHTVMHLSFTIGAVYFYKLCFQYVGNEKSFVKEANNEILDLRTPPCCCFISSMAPMIPTDQRLFTLRCIIFQMPIIQSIIMVTLNCIYYAEPKMYEKIFLFFAPFIIISILTGMWGLNILTRMIHKVHNDYNLMKKFICLQLVLILCKLQYVILFNQLDNVTFGLNDPEEHTIYKNAIINLLILVEMIPLSLLAQQAYRKPEIL